MIESESKIICGSGHAAGWRALTSEAYNIRERLKTCFSFIRSYKKCGANPSNEIDKVTELWANLDEIRMCKMLILRTLQKKKQNEAQARAVEERENFYQRKNSLQESLNNFKWGLSIWPGVHNVSLDIFPDQFKYVDDAENLGQDLLSLVALFAGEVNDAFVHKKIHKVIREKLKDKMECNALYFSEGKWLYLPRCGYCLLDKTSCAQDCQCPHCNRYMEIG